MIEGLIARSKWRSGKLEPVLSILYNLAELLMIQGGFPNLVVQDSLEDNCTGCLLIDHFAPASSYLQVVRSSTQTASNLYYCNPRQRVYNYPCRHHAF